MRSVMGFAVLALSFAAASATAQEVARPSEAEVRAVLEAWEADHMLASLSRAADKMLVDVGSSLTGPTRARVSIALTDAFSVERLHASLVAFLRAPSRVSSPR